MDRFKDPDEAAAQRSEEGSFTPHSQSKSPVGVKPQWPTAGPEELTAGQMVAGRYRIECFVGRGAMGSVYAVEQVFLKKRFALKTLNPVVASDITTRRFHKEAQAASRLDHPNLVRAVDFGVIGQNRPFLVMDFVEGQTLSQCLKEKGRLPFHQAVQIFICVASAIAYAHQEGIIHRDIKPSNIMLVPSATAGGDLIPKVVDLGIAKLEYLGGEDTEANALTRTGEVFGTPLYMSPEQCLGVKVDNRSDIYSLGCVLFETLTGAPPFRGDSALETMMQHREMTEPTLKEASLGEEFPEALQRIVSKMLAKDPAARYQTCRDVVTDLTWLQKGMPERVEAQACDTKLSRKNAPSMLQQYLVVAIASIVCTASATWFFMQQVLHMKAAPSHSATVPLSDIGDTANTSGRSTASYEEGVDDGTFSVIAGNLRMFKFPERYSLGQLLWRDQHHKPKSVEAMGNIYVPLSAKVIYRMAALVCADRPHYVLGFKSRDLSGVIVAPQDTLTVYNDDEMANRAVNHLRNLKGLRALSIKHVPLNQDSLDVIGGMTQLRWLSLDDCALSGKAVAGLKNLGNLRVLEVEGIDSAVPVLRQLAKNNTCIQRLRILKDKRKFGPKNKWTDEEVLLATKLRSLTDLDLSDYWQVSLLQQAPGRQCNQLILELSKLHNLQRLDVGGYIDLISNQSEANVKTLAAAMPHLRELVAGEVKQLPAALSARLNHYLPHTRFLTSIEAGEKWFDLLEDDPRIQSLL